MSGGGPDNASRRIAAESGLAVVTLGVLSRAGALTWADVVARSAKDWRSKAGFTPAVLANLRDVLGELGLQLKGDPKTTGGTAVMARRGADVVASDDAKTALNRSLDYYPTPPWAARAIGTRVKALDPLAKTCWEPACGEGHMAEPLKGYFDRVRASDVHAHGYGEVIDFLLASSGEGSDWIITNPPFRLAAQFASRALDRANRGVVMLCRLAFLESADRFELLYGREPLTFVAPFIERVPMQLGSWNPRLATATAYAAFIWVKGGSPHVLPGLAPFPPGTKARCVRPDDATRFGETTSAPLFEGDAA